MLPLRIWLDRPNHRARLVAGLAALALLPAAGWPHRSPSFQPPLPPPRPAETDMDSGAPAGPPPEPAEVVAPEPPDGPEPSGCVAALARAGLQTEPASHVAAGDCRIEEPVRLVGLRPPGGPPLAFPDRPVVACRLAAGLGAWLGGVVSPVLTVQLGAPPVAVRTGPGFECRSRNRVPGGKMSAHGLGQAIDIAGFELADRRNVTVPAAGAWAPAFASIRVAACGWFTTVLGPGSDSYHSGHLHLDVQQHGSSDRYRICQ